MFLLIGAALASDLGDEIAHNAARYLEHKPRLSIEACNGLVLDILEDSGVHMTGRVTTLYAQMEDQGWLHKRNPQPGDIVYFDKTYDSNRNGRVDDYLTHIAVVISVDDDNTVHMVHRASSGIKPLTMNLDEPGLYVRGDKVVNSYLAARSYGADGRRMAGELFRAFGTVEEGYSSGDVVLASASPPPSRKAPDPKKTRKAAEPKAPPPPKSSKRRNGDAVVSVVEPPAEQTREESTFDAPRVARRVIQGKKLRHRTLDELSCEELWYLRNAAFARHGYAFQTPEAQAAFGGARWYEMDPRVTHSTVGELLQEVDLYNVAHVTVEEEERCR